jgi:hypothetical protein
MSTDEDTVLEDTSLQDTSLQDKQDDNVTQDDSEKEKSSQIVFVSSHYPSTTLFAKRTRRSFEKYTKTHGYSFFYDEIEPEEKDMHVLHYNRCQSLQRAYEAFPNGKWFVWVDSDVFVNRMQQRVENFIDLSDDNILYHLFHERPWIFPVNTGVKFVNVKAIPLEKEMFELRNTPPFNEFPYEQKCIIEHILPKIPGQYIIHDPYYLNCIFLLYSNRIKRNALFIHLCSCDEEKRNRLIDRIIGLHN